VSISEIRGEKNDYPLLGLSPTTISIHKSKTKINKRRIKKMNQLIDYLKPVLVRSLADWLLKIGGGALGIWGVSSGNITIISGAVVSVAIGLLLSLFKYKKLGDMNPHEFTS
jgi:hypothetical protein